MERDGVKEGEKREVGRRGRERRGEREGRGGERLFGGNKRTEIYVQIWILLFKEQKREKVETFYKECKRTVIRWNGILGTPKPENVSSFCSQKWQVVLVLQINPNFRPPPLLSPSLQTHLWFLRQISYAAKAVCSLTHTLLVSASQVLGLQAWWYKTIIISLKQ